MEQSPSMANRIDKPVLSPWDAEPQSGAEINSVLGWNGVFIRISKRSKD
jgi:hypothetical protein